MLHVGALRDALFKFLFSRSPGGTNILRIEDTDRARYNPESEAEFIETLKWVGIEFDEGPHVGGPFGPYRQSERKDAGLYAPWIQLLLEQGHAYKAFDTPEELERMRDEQTASKQNTGYFGGEWRDATPEKVAGAEAAGRPFVIRQRIPRDITIAIEDAIRGRIEWDSNNIDDPVLIKADGMPTYHLASMVDDHLMEITHIMRGEEWIGSAAKHAVLFDQLGWERPVFVHCPVIVGSDGKKLSKRHGATRVLDYAAQGFLPSALKNFIALIGWNPGDDREVLSEQELIDSFSLSGMQASPGRFDIEKLTWLNGAHIRALSPEELLAQLIAYVANPYTSEYWASQEEEIHQPGKAAIDGKRLVPRLGRIEQAATEDRTYLLKALDLERERVSTLADFGEALEFFLVEQPNMDEKAVAKWFKQEHVGDLLDRLVMASNHVTADPIAYWEGVLRDFQEEKGIEKLGPIVHPTRVAMTGKTYGPGLFELMAVLGPDRVRARAQAARSMVL